MTSNVGGDDPRHWCDVNDLDGISLYLADRFRTISAGVDPKADVRLVVVRQGGSLLDPLHLRAITVGPGPERALDLVSLFPVRHVRTDHLPSLIRGNPPFNVSVRWSTS